MQAMLSSGAFDQPQSLSMLVWALGRLRVRPPTPWAKAAAAALLRSSATPAAGDSKAPHMDRGSSSSIGVSQASHRGQDGISVGVGVGQSACAMSVRCFAVALTGLAWSVRTRLPPHLHMELGARVAQALATDAARAAEAGAGWRAAPRGAPGAQPQGRQAAVLTARTLPMLLWASASMGLELSERSRAHALAAARTYLPSSATLHVVISVWALERLRCVPDVAWCAEVSVLVDARWMELDGNIELKHLFVGAISALRRRAEQEAEKGG